MRSPDSREGQKLARVLLVQPWIHDFAAYDFWIKPLGLLRLGAFLRRHAVEVFLLDLLDPHHPALKGEKLRRTPLDRGALPKQEIPKPPELSWFPRRYHRYGIPPSLAQGEIKKIPPPDAVLVTSGMTYWYPGVRETISFCRRFFPDAPIILGGIYATLLPEHALEVTGADLVIPGGEPGTIQRELSRILPLGEPKEEPFPPPAWDIARGHRSIAVKTSEGCPFRCSYCASRLLSPRHTLRPVQEVVEEITHSLKLLGAEDVAFYDDALLFNAESHILPILRGLSSLGPIRIHCPNGLHARYIDPEMAKELRHHGFYTIRLGLESSNPSFHSQMDSKLTIEEFRLAVESLMEAGYKGRDIGVYILAGLPGQTIEDLENTVRFVLDLGLRPHLAEYSPIPGTDLWEEAKEASPFPISQEPLFHNNTLLPCRGKRLSYEEFMSLKAKLHRALDGGLGGRP
jgi:molybdenum cofactor biosynthesis enzyme MoaA